MTLETTRRQGRALVRLALYAVLAGAVLCAPAPAPAQQTQEAAAAPAGELLGPEELRPLVAPIALYPDDLLAILLPASTNPVQIVEAARFLEKRRTDKTLQPNAEWDPSVLALINYPQVVAKMDADLSWTTALGNAVIDQLDDVLGMIQQLRAEASATGYLQSNEFLLVVWEDDYWHIDSSDPDWIYVPDYPDEIFERPEHPIVKPPGEGGQPSPEHPIVLPPEGGAQPSQPIATPPTDVARPTQPIAYPPPSYVGQHPYWSPGATFFAGAFLGAAFGYGLNWGGGDIDINYGANCCRGGNINIGNDIDIGSGNRVDHRTGDRFNADKQRVNGRDTMKWNGNKARQKAATGKAGAGRTKAGTLPAKNANTGAAAKQKGTLGAKQKSRAGDLQPSRGNGGSLGNYQSGRDASKLGNKGNRSLQDSRSRQPAGALSNDRSRSRSNAGAFGGYDSGSSVYRQSTRGGGSMRSGGGRRGGGGGRRR